MPVDVDDLARIGGGIPITKVKEEKPVSKTQQKSNIQTVDDLANIGSGKEIKKKATSEESTTNTSSDQSTIRLTDEAQQDIGIALGDNTQQPKSKVGATQVQFANIPKPKTAQEQLADDAKRFIARKEATKKSIDIYNQTYGTKFNADEVTNNPEKAAEFFNLYKDRYDKALHPDIRVGGAPSILQIAKPVGIDQALINYNAPPPSKIIARNELISKGEQNLELLKNKVVDLTIDEARLKGIPKKQLINNLHKRLDPKGYDARLKAIDERTTIGLSDLVSGGPFLKDNSKDIELLNTEKAPYEFAINESLRRQANDRIASGTLQGDERLISDGKSLLAQVRDNDDIYASYPSLNKSRVAEEISKELAAKAGQLKGTEAEGLDVFNKVRGYTGSSNIEAFTTEAFKKFYDNPKTRDAALEVAANPDSYLSDASYFGGIEKNIAKPFKELGLSLLDIAGVRDKMDRLADTKNEELFPEVTPELKGYVSKIKGAINTTAYLTGMMALQVPSTAAAANIGLGTKAAHRVGTGMAFGIPSFDANLKDADNFLESDGAKVAYATIGSMINTVGGEFLELGKISKFKELQKPLLELSEKITDKNITEGAVKELLDKAKDPYVNALVKYGANVTKGAAVMSYFTFANGVNKMLFGGNETSTQLVENTGTAFVDGLLSMSVLGGFGAHADLQKEKNTSYKANIKSLADNSDAARDLFDLAYKNGDYTRPEYNEKVQILNTIISAKSSLDIAEAGASVPLDAGQRSVYVANRTAEGVIKKQLESPLLTEKQKSGYEAQLKRLETQREDILQGLTFNDNLEPLNEVFDAQKEYRKAYEDFNEGVVENDSEVLKAKQKLETAMADYSNKNKPKDETVNQQTSTESSTEKGSTDKEISSEEKASEESSGSRTGDNTGSGGAAGSSTEPINPESREGGTGEAGEVDKRELTPQEQTAIEGFKDAEFKGSTKNLTDILQSETATPQEKKQVLTELKEQLSDPNSEIATGEALGKYADLIYDLIDADKKETPTENKNVVSPSTEEVNPALKDVESTAKALQNAIEGNNLSDMSSLIPYAYRQEIIKKLSKDNRAVPHSETISEAYHKAKIDDSNPELVKAVESLLPKSETKSVSPSTESISEEVKVKAVKNADGTVTVQSGTGFIKAKDEVHAESIAKKLNGRLEFVDSMDAPTQKETAKPLVEESEKSIKSIVEKFDNEENYTIEDLVNDAEGLAENTGNKKISDAVEEYRKAQDEDRKLSGRGDMDSANDAVEKIIRTESQNKPIPNEGTPIESKDISSSIKTEANGEHNEGDSQQKGSESGEQTTRTKANEGENESGEKDVNNPEGAVKESAAPSKEVSGENKEIIGITHAKTNEVAKELGFPEYEVSPETVKEWDAEVDKRLSENPNAITEMMDKYRNKSKIDKYDQRMMLKYHASLKARINDNPTSALLKEYNEARNLSNIEGGREVAKSLVARKGSIPVEDNFANYLAEETRVSNVETLPQEQIDGLRKKYEDDQKVIADLSERIQKLEDEAAKKVIYRLAEKESKNNQKTKKTSEDFTKERTEIRQSIKDKIKAAKEKANAPDAPKVQGVSGRTYLDDLFLISPDVLKLVKSYVEEGIVNLADIVVRAHEEIKEHLPDITERDIRDIIKGEYTEKKQTRNEVAAQMRELKSQQKLIDKLEDLRNAKPSKDPVQRQKRSEKVQELMDEVKKFYDEKRSEDDAIKSAEKEYRKKAEQAVREEERLVREFEKETDRNKKKELNAKVSEAKNISKELDKKSPEESALQSYKTGLKNKIGKLKKDLETGDYLKEPEPKSPLKLDKEAERLKDEHIRFVKETNIRRAKAEFENRGKGERVYDGIMQVLGIKRIVQTAIDLSIPFRQGVTLAFNPRRWRTFGKSFGSMMQSVFSPKRFDRLMYDIHQSPDYQNMLKDKITFNEMDAVDSNSRNEDFQKSFVYKIPFIREPLLASNRAADGFLNVARYEMYMNGKRMLERQGITRDKNPEHYEALGKWAMNMTGRGNMLKAIEDSHSARMIASNTFFGARLMASRFNMLNPIYYVNMPKEVRVEALKDMATFTGMLIATGLAASAAGADVSLDIDDSDFLKIKVGDTKYDISGGLVQYVRTYLRLNRLVANRLFKPDMSQKEKDKYATYALNSTSNFFRYKLAPNTSYSLSALKGKDPLGQPFDATDALKIYPMYVDDMITGYKENGVVSLVTIGLPSILGIGVQTYEDKPKK